MYNQIIFKKSFYIMEVRNEKFKKSFNSTYDDKLILI